MKLNIPPLGQRDEKWRYKKLGTSNTTIGKYGCLLTCHSMMLTYYGHEGTPDLLNEIYKTKDVFDQGNLINFWKAGDVYTDIRADEYYNCYDVPCDLTRIDRYLSEKKPVIALVDFDKTPSNDVQTHFVLIIGKTEDGHYLINDPWTGETYFFDTAYGDPARFIYGLRLYSGTPADGEDPEDKYQDALDKLNSCNEGLAQKSLEVNELRNSLESQEAQNSDLANQLAKARGERDKEAWAKEQCYAGSEKLQTEVDSLHQQLEEKDGEINLLKAEIAELKEKAVSKYSRWELFMFTIKAIFTK